MTQPPPAEPAADAGAVAPLRTLLATPAIRVTLLALLLLGLAVLIHHRQLSIIGWADQPMFPASHYPALLLCYAVGFAMLELTRLPRRAVLAVTSLATAAIYSPLFLAASLVWIVLFHRVLILRVRFAWKLAFVVASFIALALPCDMAAFPHFVASHPWLAAFGLMFAVNYTFRIFHLLSHARMVEPSELPLTDTLLYFLLAPFFIVVPYMLAIPRFDHFRAGLDRADPRVVASGLRLLALGILWCVAYQAAVRAFDPEPLLVTLLREGRWLEAIPVALCRYPVRVVFSTIGHATVLLGMVRTLGIDMGPALARPLAATSVNEWWRRYNTHFRDLLVDLFFYPVMMRWRRRYPNLAIVAACFAVFVIGSTLLHWPKLYFSSGSHLRLPIGFLAENLAMTVIVAGALLLERRRSRGPAPLPTPTRSAPSRLARTGAHVLATWLIVLGCVVGIGYGTSYALHHAPAEVSRARTLELRTLARAGCAEAAGRTAADLLEPATQASQLAPRDAALRLDLALLSGLPGPARDLAAARRELELARLLLGPDADALPLTEAHALYARSLVPGGHPSCPAR